jgi:ADP-ribosylglycohydrolase
LASGDAVGTTVEFRSRGSFPPVTDMVGGGPFDLAPGQWTDDTSMALCLAESLLAHNGFDARGQMGRYLLAAANLGDDADTTAAIVGQVAGAFYGLEGIPQHWLNQLHLRDQILSTAEALYEASSLRAVVVDGT